MTTGLGSIQFGQDMLKKNHSIKAYVRDHAKEMFALLKEMVLIQSGSRNKAGVDHVGQLIGALLTDLPLSVETVVQDTAGNHLVAQTGPASTGRSGILLVGHMDTVFGEDTHFNGYREDDRHSYGPGVIDMKGGLVAGITALKALHHIGGLDRIPITFIFNSDEEIGSTTSRELIRSHAARNRLAFVMECGGPNGEVVTGRKGNLSAGIDIKGEAGHAAFAEKNKASAILALAPMIVAIEALNDQEKGITANVGVISGGTTPNTIAEHASARIDMRFIQPPDYDALTQKLQAIARSSTIPGVAAQLHIRTCRPPMPASPKNNALFQLVKGTAETLGMSIGEEFRQGVSDANIIAHAGIPVIDGLGPIGAKDHSDKEYMIKTSLGDRSILLACAIDACWKEMACGQESFLDFFGSHQ